MSLLLCSNPGDYKTAAAQLVCSVCLQLNDEEARSAALEVINRPMLLLHNGVGTYRYLSVMPRLRRRIVSICVGLTLALLEGGRGSAYLR